MLMTSLRAGVSRLEFMFVAAIAVGLFGLTIPALSGSRERMRQDQCRAHLQAIGLGLLQYEQAHGRLPASTTTNVNYALAGDWQGDPTVNATRAGYSWLMMILPYVEEPALYDKIASRSNDWTRAAFDAAMTPTGELAGPGNPHFATVPIELFRCPSFSGATTIDGSPGSKAPPAYASASIIGPASDLQQTGVAISNYVAVSGTHLSVMDRIIPDLDTDDRDSDDLPNGSIVPGKRTRLKEISDGESRTIIVCETKEPNYASWYDGTTAWTVLGLSVNPVNYHTFASGSERLGRLDRKTHPMTNPNGWWFYAYKNDDYWTSPRSAFNFGPRRQGRADQDYFITSGFAGALEKSPWGFGPSSEHPDWVMPMAQRVRSTSTSGAACCCILSPERDTKLLEAVAV